MTEENGDGVEVEEVVESEPETVSEAIEEARPDPVEDEAAEKAPKVLTPKQQQAANMRRKNIRKYGKG